MRVIITAGGTGGHIYPALAVIEKLKKTYKNLELLYIGTHNRMEKDIIPKHNINYQAIKIFGLSRKNPFKAVKTLYYLIKANITTKKIIKDFKPDIVIGVGGYVTAPVIASAYKLKIPTIIHEQNVKPGLANKYLIKYASIICVSFKETIQYIKNKEVVFTGNPTSEAAILSNEANKEDYNLQKNKKLILISMGSLGSSTINKILSNIFSDIYSDEFEILFVTGEANFNTIDYKDFSKNVKVVPYIPKLTEVMKVTDLIITRGGASTLAEITALGTPSIIIPSPYVANNEQYYNALTISETGGALLVEEKELTSETLKKQILELISNPKKLKIMSEKTKLHGIPNSTELLLEVIKELTKNKIKEEK